jgi:Tfp pilus assembly protein PilN
MGRMYLVISMLFVAILVSGCAGIQKCMDGSYDKQISELTIANSELKKEIARVEEVVKKDGQILAEKQAAIKELEAENESLFKKVKQFEMQNEKQKLEQAAVEQKPVPVPPPVKEKPDLKKVRIKILAGKAQMAKAKGFSTKLKGKGYKVERVNRAQKAFAKTTVYYASGFEKEAKAISRELGPRSITQPLTWKSVFNVIIGIGKNR